MTTLSEIVRIGQDDLYRKFDLEVWYCDPHKKENLAFLSPTVLLDDRELREGGFKDRGPKEVLGRLANDILTERKSKQCSFFQVPEIPFLHMGYGKSSENKKSNMALTENEAKVWMTFLDLSCHKKPGEVLREGETPMEEVTFPAPERHEDYHAFDFEEGDAEELVDPNKSGLKRRVKGSYLLFFSILLIFYKKKDPAPAANSKEKQEAIGANKISDFLLFWIIPYLLNFTHQKVNAINAHHAECKRKSAEHGEPFQVPTVQKSAFDIIQEAMQSCKVSVELQKTLMDKYRKYYGTEQLKRKYNLPATKAHTPIILVPLHYKVRDMPVEIEDLGTKWQQIGDVRLFDEFISKFVEIEEVQTDYFDSFGDLPERFASDYGIILPDEATFAELIEKIEDEHADIFREMPKQGRKLAPRLGLVKDTEKNRSVCFSYFSKEHKNKDLFRLVGLQRLSHFNLVVLHGACLNPNDPYCKLLSLYPVKAYRRCSYDEQQRILGPKSEGKFCSLEFPEKFKLWEQAVLSDSVVRKVTQSRGELNYPKYIRQPLEVVYTVAKHLSKLKKDVFRAAVTTHNLQALEECHIRAANLKGCLLPDIARRGRLKNVALVVAINDILEPEPVLRANLQDAMNRVIAHFVQAVIAAGLPSVYPPEPDEDEGYVNEESDSSEEDMDETSDIQQPSTSGVTSSGESGISISSPSSQTASKGESKMEEECSQQPTTLSGATSLVTPPMGEAVQIDFKEGKPSDPELDELAGKIGQKWRKLGIHLGISNDVLEGIAANAEDKPFAVLLHWRENTSSAAPYRELYTAMCHDRVGLRTLAEEFCCKATT